MGLLTDPSLTRRNQFGRSLVNHNRKICAFFYVAGIVWFCCLGNPEFNHATYFSENALSPGLVYTEIKQESSRLAQTYMEELLAEREKHKTEMPYSWISAKMKQIGLETHTHSFTLNYPFGGGKVYKGKNIYGILRAPRIASTEGIVFSAPYRTTDSVHTEITASVPILLAFAEFATKKNYWAKDLIFLVTDQEQLGMHSWLDAYYNGGMRNSSLLSAGNLPARAGALQAALNLEIQDFDLEHIDIKIEGLNGQLPNLDFFNLIQKISSREGLSSGYKQFSRKERPISQTTTKENLRNIMSMILTQANGVPTGNHGLFHPYRIEALTLEGVKRTRAVQNGRNSGGLPMLKTIEGISRSLNNLPERFHQSYFFYILVQNKRFISIGDFMPSLVAMAAPLLIKAFLIWLSLADGDHTDIFKKTSTADRSKDKIKEIDVVLPYIKVAFILAFSGGLGILATLLPMNRSIADTFAAQGISTEIIISAQLAFISAIGLLLPVFINLTPNGKDLLHIAALVYLGTVLIVVGLLNFALGFILSIIISPLAILLNTNESFKFKNLTRIYTFLLNPLVVSYCSVFVVALLAFPELALKAIAVRAIEACMVAITYSVVDAMIYSNWLFVAIAGVFFPAWILFWILATSRTETLPKQKVKTN